MKRPAVGNTLNDKAPYTLNDKAPSDQLHPNKRSRSARGVTGGVTPGVVSSKQEDKSSVPASLEKEDASQLVLLSSKDAAPSRQNSEIYAGASKQHVKCTPSDSSSNGRNDKESIQAPRRTKFQRATRLAKAAEAAARAAEAARLAEIVAAEKRAKEEEDRRRLAKLENSKRWEVGSAFIFPSVDYVHFDPKASGNGLEISVDQLTVSGIDGYRMARCSHFVEEGSWYCEMKFCDGTENSELGHHLIKEKVRENNKDETNSEQVDKAKKLSDGKEAEVGIEVGTTRDAGSSKQEAADLKGPKRKKAAVRLGWVVGGDARYDGPVGFRKGYAYRSFQGQKVHKSVRQKYGEPYSEGDIIGLYISFDPVKKENEGLGTQVDSSQKTDAESASKTETTSSLLLPSTSSSEIDEVTQGPARIEFYKNGVSQGLAYTYSPPTAIAEPSLPISLGSSLSSSSSGSSSVSSQNLDAQRRRIEETKKFMATMSTTKFFPAASIYGPAVVTLNPGPNFEFTPPKGARPLCERVR